MDAELIVQRQIESWDGVLDPDLIESPFNDPLLELANLSHIVVDRARRHMKANWGAREFRLVFVNGEQANACAIKGKDTDYVLITKGLIESVYGTIGGLMDVPSAMPAIGTKPTNDPVLSDLVHGFPKFPLLSKQDLRSHVSIRVYWPDDVARSAFAMELSARAMAFVLRHEIGHIFAGHLELCEGHSLVPMIQEAGLPSGRVLSAPPLRVLECDADTFAVHAQSFMDLQPGLVDSLVKTFGWNSVPCKDAGFIAHAIAISGLFRLLDSLRGDGYAPGESEATSHPHPSVRSNMAIARTLSLAVDAGMFRITDLPRLVSESLIPVEELWERLQLPGRRLGPRDDWITQIGRLTAELDLEYQKYKPILNEVSRIHTGWHGSWPRLLPANTKKNE